MKGSALEPVDSFINSFKKFIFGSSLCSDWGRCWRFNNIQTCVLIEKTQNWRNMYNQLNKYKHRIHSGCHRGHLVLEKDHFKNIWREKLRPRFLNYGEKKLECLIVVWHHLNVLNRCLVIYFHSEKSLCLMCSQWIKERQDSWQRNHLGKYAVIHLA